MSIRKEKWHVDQIKLFRIDDENPQNTSDAVNEYVVKITGQTGNNAVITHSEGYVSVTCSQLKEIEIVEKKQ